MPPRQSNSQRRASELRKRGNNGKSGAAKRSSRGGSNIPGWVWVIVGLVVGILVTKHFLSSSQETEPAGGKAAIVTRPTPPPEETDSDQSGQQDKSAHRKSDKKSAKSGKDNQDSDVKNQQDAANRMPSFEFYTLLPESEVIAPDVPDSSQTTMSTLPETPAQKRQGQSPSQATAKPQTQPQVAASTPTKAQTATTTATSAPAKDPAATPSASNLGGAKYMLQAASFRNKGDAQTMANRFRDRGLTTLVTQVQTGDGATWYRVQAGPYSSTADLAQARGIMKANGIDPLTLRQR